MTADQALSWLKKRGKRSNVEGMARYAIRADKVFGVSVGDVRKLAKETGRSHALADSLWRTGWYEARLLAAFVDEPERVTPAQMDRWCRDFDNWAICDTLCFHLFDRTPHAWSKVKAWAAKSREFEKRAAFALLASLALHDKEAKDAPFAAGLKLIEREAADERNFVKKAVNWALRGIGERNRALNGKAIDVASRLAESDDATERWVGKDALRQLKSPASRRRVNSI